MLSFACSWINDLLLHYRLPQSFMLSIDMNFDWSLKDMKCMYPMQHQLEQLTRGLEAVYWRWLSHMAAKEPRGYEPKAQFLYVWAHQMMLEHPHSTMAASKHTEPSRRRSRITSLSWLSYKGSSLLYYDGWDKPKDPVRFKSRVQTSCLDRALAEKQYKSV